jgi:hypothetical protein
VYYKTERLSDERRSPCGAPRCNNRNASVGIEPSRVELGIGFPHEADVRPSQ